MISLLALCSNWAEAQSRVIFWEDFETQDFSAWSGTDQNNPASLSGTSGRVTASQPHSGRYSFQATLPAPGRRVKVFHAFPAEPSIYMRFYFYVDPEWTQASPVALASIEGGVKLYLCSKSGALYLRDQKGLQGTHPIARGAWHSLEISSSVAASGGSESVWLDGTTEIAATGLSTSGSFARVYLGFDVADGTQSGTVYFDDVVVSTQRIGAPAAGLTVRHPNTNARSAMPVDVVLFGQTPTDILTARVDGVPVYTQNGALTGHHRFTLALDRLEVGDHRLQVTLQDAGGKVKASYEDAIHKYVSGTPNVSIDANNNLHFGGSSFFPVTPFEFLRIPSSSTWLAKAAVNTYGWSACYADAYAYSASQFKNCVESVRMPFIGPDDRWAGASASQYAANAPNAAETVTDYVLRSRGNRNLLMWTWKDEPDIGPAPGHVSAAQMRALARATHDSDGNHPVLTNLAGYPYSNVRNRRNGWHYPVVPNSSDLVSDVYAFDMYPFIYQKDGWTVTQLVEQFERVQRYTYDLVPWMAFIEAGKCSAGHPCAGYGPTAEQVNMEAWLAVIHGMKGIAWWGPAGWTDQEPSHWKVLAQFLKDTTALKDAILSTTTRTVRSDQTAPHSRVDVAVREDSRYIYVLAARLSDIGEDNDPPISATLSISGLENGTALVLNESRTVSVMGGQLMDTFSPLAVHLYRIPK